MLLPKLPIKTTPEHHLLKVKEGLKLENEENLKPCEIAYTTYGSLNKAADNVVWVFHALTANADPSIWWPELVGENKLFNPDEHYIVCANAIGSCYGSTGPASTDDNKQFYLNRFPLVTIKDIVKAHQILKTHLQINKISIGIGGSLGGQQLLEWASAEPELFDCIIPIATNSTHSAWGIAFNEAQRMSLEADPTFINGQPDGGKSGLKAARATALLSYRSKNIYDKAQTNADRPLTDFKASSYQQYQGKKLADRFSAHSYFTLSKAMDSHNIGRGRESLEIALAAIKSKALVIGIDSDLLFPIEEQEYIAKHIPEGNLEIISSIYGHDGFLIEEEQLEMIIRKYIMKWEK